MRWTPSRGTGRSSGQLLALSAWAVALLLWTYADRLQDERQALEQRLSPLTGRSAALRSGDIDSATRSADAAAAQRRAAEQRLKVEQSEQLMRATVLYELRSACAAAGVKSCSVRLSEGNAAAANPADRPKPVSASASGASANGGLDTLGIGRARAIVSGNLAADELEQIFAILNKQQSAVWRINGFNVRNNSFELDVERHFMAPGASERPNP